MAAASYYHNIPNSSSQVDLSDVSRIPMSDPGLRPAQGLPSPPKSPLKPMFLGQTHPASPGYHNVGFEDELEVVQKTDEVCSSTNVTKIEVNRTDSSNSNAKSALYASYPAHYPFSSPSQPSSPLL